MRLWEYVGLIAATSFLAAPFAYVWGWSFVDAYTLVAVTITMTLVADLARKRHSDR